MVRVLTVVAALGLLSGACVRAHVRMIEPSRHRAAFCPEAVTVYADSTTIGKDFVKVAWLTPAHSPDLVPSRQQLRDALRKKAAQLGANGLVLSPPDTALPVFDGLALFVPADSMRSVDLCRHA